MLRFTRTLALILLLPTAVFADAIKVGAAVSLKDAFADIAKTYAAESGDTVEFVFGSSGQIAMQIKAGAGLDAFVSAANTQVDDLGKADLLDLATRRVIVRNALVLVVPPNVADGPKSFDDLKTSTGKIAVGEPKTVPAGQYAAQVFKALHLEGDLSARLVYGTNVRQVLAYVERGEVVAGIVYATDAKESGDKVKVVATADEDTHEPILYPAAVVTASTHKDAAKKFLDYLGTPEAQAALAAHGFALPMAAAKP